ncbi:hypothetical protein HMPREF3171_03345 [Corynebacterium sp. HMSC08F01]|nr:hypothetical protein HMPREF3171_03345 [Corynebacterium sp. HMSC08F01]
MQSYVCQQVYENLLKSPLQEDFKLDRIADGTDRDYLVLTSQLRRYFYGNLSEGEISSLLRMPTPPLINLSGQVALFPADSTLQSWEFMDHYIRRTVYRALQKRKRLVSRVSCSTDQPAMWSGGFYSFDKMDIISSKNETVHMALPSTVRMHRLVTRLVDSHGPSVINNHQALYN